MEALQSHPIVSRHLPARLLTDGETGRRVWLTGWTVGMILWQGDPTLAVPEGSPQQRPTKPATRDGMRSTMRQPEHQRAVERDRIMDAEPLARNGASQHTHWPGEWVRAEIGRAHV